MAIILAGDTHGLIDMDKVTEYFEYNNEFTKEDYLIILGDAGVLWNGVEDANVQKILNNLPVTTLWIDGNHENFDLLEEYSYSRYTSEKRTHKRNKNASD